MRLIVGFLCLLSVGLSASFSEMSFTAKQAYESSRYIQATELYAQGLSQAPDHPDLLFNMGNACFKNGDLGLAIVWYLRALKIEPHDQDIRHNLMIARSQVVKTGPEQLGVFAATVGWPVYHVSLLGWLWSAAAAVFCVVLIWRVSIVPTWLRSLCVVSLGILLLGAGARYVLDTQPIGVVVADKVVLRAGPSQTVRVVDYLHEGVEVLLKAEYDGWREVSLKNGVSGWVGVDALVKR